MKEQEKEKYILFSPLSRVDPIYDDHDGSMLHTCRKYHPEAVILYLSAEMYENHIKDDRYRKSIKRLAETEGFETEIKVEERPDLREVNDYELFFDEFRPLLEIYHKEYPEHQIILNISSGTPQMQANLYMLASFLPFPVVLAQTGTHEKKQNSHGRRNQEFEFELFWQNNFDNDKELFSNRCKIVKNQNLNLEIQKKNIGTLLDNFDYAAALNIALSDELSALLNSEGIELLKAAKMRSELNAKQIQSKEIKAKFGVNGDNQNKRLDIAEFLLWLDMKYQRGDLGDYLRGITPAIFALMKLGVEEKGAFPISEKCCRKNNFFSSNKLDSEDVGQRFLGILRNNGKNPGAFLTSGHYDVIIEDLYSDRTWAEPLRQLRAVEETVRNDLAHSITPINKEWIEKRLIDPDIKANQKLRENGINTVGKVHKLFKQAADALNKDMPRPNSTKLDVNWDAYNVMNKEIKKALGIAFT